MPNIGCVFCLFQRFIWRGKSVVFVSLAEQGCVKLEGVIQIITTSSILVFRQSVHGSLEVVNSSNLWVKVSQSGISEST